MALDEPQESDESFDQSGITVVVDPQSYPLIAGAEVDFKETLMGGGFTVSNPNAARTCGCGQSFRTPEDAGEPGDC